MSKKKYFNEKYLVYTEYYIISGAYHMINVVNEILTCSASYADTMKGYLHNKVVSKQFTLDELLTHEQNKNSNGTIINNANNNDDVDEDGFVVIKARRPRIRNKGVIVEMNNNAIIHNIGVNPVAEPCILREIIEEVINNIINNK